MRNLVVIGIGELGKLFGAAALRAGIRVTPITRQMSIERSLQGCDPGTPILVAVGEQALGPVLDGLPRAHRSSLILLQNELFPSAWRGLEMPTVLIPWVLQKRGLPTQVAAPSPYFGKHAALLRELLEHVPISGHELVEQHALMQALVDKYTFILTINTLGVLVDRSLGRWLEEDAPLVASVCAEASELGAALCGTQVDHTQCLTITKQAMLALATVPARGRTALDRVTRAHHHAQRLGIDSPILKQALEGAQSAS